MMIMDQRIELLIAVGKALRGITLISNIIGIIACWKIFNKFGEPGWKALIPFYNTYILYKYSWDPAMFWSDLICVILSTVGTSPFPSVILILVVHILISIYMYYKLAKCFGHDILFTLGLVFLPLIFLFILGFGEDQYLGKQSCTIE